MKTRISILFLLFVSVITLTSATGISGDASKSNHLTKQTVDDVFRSFNIHRQGKGISLSWTVSSNYINSYVIQRSYDGEYFDDIDLHIKSLGRWNRANDNDVFPGFIHYRIIAILEDGTEVMSPVQVVRIVRRK